MFSRWSKSLKPSKYSRESRRCQEKLSDELTPDQYRARDTLRVARFQVTGKKYADATTASIDRVERFWYRHYTFMGVETYGHLAENVAEHFRVYADWRLKNFNITKQSTIWVEWKFLRLLVKRETGRKVDELIGEQFILGPLTDEYDLDLSTSYKPVVSVEDLIAILHYHWCVDTASVTHERYTLQNALLMLFIAYTSARPGALIESGCLRGSNEALCYKDIALRVVPNPDQPERHLLVMEVSLLFMKGKRGKSQPTTYIFHERDDNLALCPVSHFIALALADDAFEARGIVSVEDILRVRVPAHRNSLHLKWKADMLDVPVFRRAMHTAEGVRISPDKALPYDILNQYLQRLGRNAGFENKLTPYCIRRGTANAVDTVATPSERNQIMGHSRADIFERYYISMKVKRDVQSAYLGCPPKESIIRTVGRFSLTRDPRAPKELGKADGEKIWISFKSQEHNELQVEDPKNVQFVFKERKRLSQNLFRSSDCRVEDHTEIYARRVQTIQDWVSLCSLREGPRKRRAASADSGIDLAFDEIIDADTFPALCPGTQCLFCLGDDQLPLSGRIYSFSRPDHLRRHVQDCHFRYLDATAPLWCPHPSCLELLDGVQDFQGHALQVHNVYI
ncbi:FluG domain-containing protein [Blastomyces gilchristii SLH14081]|uniref:FluG domain-containing protein n=1 Tax=Blastomyces gilchristii (strain SLH14081) TaxID=559298 RepID=A0A179UUS1_BLAGS|nr:FluG domain-containing protein [Blastomyces gilchristii SLH14081]OAT11875.1 FluG domain-containing protein [Blastomyces gilchristii SLH14081]